MPGTSAWIIRTAPKKLVSNMRLTASRGTFSIGPFALQPALLTSASTSPARATAARTEASLSTSSGSFCSTSRSASVSTRRAVATTACPRRASSMAVQRPKPDEHPVISTRIRPSRDCSRSSEHQYHLGAGDAKRRRVAPREPARHRRSRLRDVESRWPPPPGVRPARSGEPTVRRRRRQRYRATASSLECGPPAVIRNRVNPRARPRRKEGKR